MNTAPYGFSIIVCTYNGSSRLQPTLENIFKQNIPEDILCELILVDNNSIDNSKEFAEQLVKDFNYGDKFTYLNESKQGLNYAVKRGITAAKYNWILLCDDDNHLDVNYISIGAKILASNNNIGALGGIGIPLFESVKPSWFDKYSGSFAIGEQNKINGKIDSKSAAVYGAGSFLRKNILMKFYDDGFQTIMSDRSGNKLTSGGDIERCFLIQLAGFDIWYDKNLVFHHLMPNSRMNWAYYLRLKAGIASGEALLSVYKQILINKNLNASAFIFSYFKRFIFNILVFIKFKLSSTLYPSSYSSDTLDLGNVILPAKIKSYSNNIAICFRHFNQIKRYL
jgi:glycosyltransferase involved in cell wall biosynthesis